MTMTTEEARPIRTPLLVHVNAHGPGPEADRIMGEIVEMLGTEWLHYEDPPNAYRFVKPWTEDGKPDPHPRVRVNELIDRLDPERRWVSVVASP